MAIGSKPGSEISGWHRKPCYQTSASKDFLICGLENQKGTDWLCKRKDQEATTIEKLIEV
jgi:hypothetical protein